MAQYTHRSQPMHRPGQSEHGHGGGALAYGGKPPSAAVPYAPQPFPTLRLHQPGYGSAALSYSREGTYGRNSMSGRLSLLYPPPAPPAHHPSQEHPPFKKIRLSAERPNNSHQPLRVDTREPVNSYNTVEVLSPNPPSEPPEDQTLRTTKDDLLQQISKVDREMALSDAQLSKLKKKQEELEQAANKPARVIEPDESPLVHRDLAQCVYAENRKKAAAAHNLLSHLGTPLKLPLYNQPRDTAVYHENIKNFRFFRKRLAQHIFKMKKDVAARRQTVADDYTERATEWTKTLERAEAAQKRRAKDARNREFFEKVFPELRKQREERERFNRLGARVKSEAELEEIADGLHEQEHEDKKMRSLTVIPPLLMYPPHDNAHYTDTNRQCLDMEAEHKQLLLCNVWTTAEKEVFKEKYLQHPKNFGMIASYLSRKNVRDCVRYYYLSKKRENYKQLLRKPRQRRSARNPPRPQSEPELPAGVTTRLQRSQGTVPRVSDKESGEEVTGPGVMEVSCISISTDIPLPTSCGSELAIRSPLPSSPPPATTPLSSAPVTTTMSSSLAPSSPAPASPAAVMADDTCTVSVVTSVVTCASPAVTSSLIVSNPNTPKCPTPQPPTPQPSTPQPPTPQQPTSKPPTPQPQTIITENIVSERVSTPSMPAIVKLPPVSVTTYMLAATCAVCGAQGAARAVSKSMAHYYGLNEDFNANGTTPRVCEVCHCRCVRSRYSTCSVPSCPGPRVRAKRLRHLPPRWHDLSTELKRPLMDEFQIPSELSKCCLACFKRITRRLETLGEPVQEPSEEEASRFRALLREHNNDWEKMSAATGRTPASLKAFYFTYKKKFQLDMPADSSGCRQWTSVSECSSSSADTDLADEVPDPGSGPAPMVPDGEMTDSASPPAPPVVRPRRKDEYDSEATETADEENDTPTNKSAPTAVTSAPSVSVTLTCASAQAQRNGPPATPLTVRDVVLNMIEISLMKNTKPTPPLVKPLPPKSASIQPRECRESLATLSVVPVASAPPPAVGASARSQDKDGVVLLHIEPRHEPLLDLSVKRPRQETANKQPYRNSEYSYRPQNERASPTAYKSKPASAPVPVNSQRITAQLKSIPSTKGSITLGTPVESRVVGRRTPPDAKSGSITAGTPLHHLPDKRNYDYFKGRSSTGYYASHPRSIEPSFASQNTAAYSRSPYGGMEQRQIIMADFITSQQMHGAGRREPVSVIQRHYPPPGHEAFTSLVDVASAATALPVPRDHEKQNHHHDIRIQERMQRDMMAQKFHHQQQQQQQQLQFQVERDRRAQAQYLERDRQIAIQQGRERERVLAAAGIQDRHLSMESSHHSPHDRLHHQQLVVSSEEARRLLPAATSTTAKHRAITPHHIERKDSRPVGNPTVSSSNLSVAGTGAGTGTVTGTGTGTSQARSEGTLTAASLIDAIITHQISQNTEQRFPVTQNNTIIVREPEPAPSHPIPGSEEHTASIKLGDLASNIITRDFCSPTHAAIMHHNNRFSTPISEAYIQQQQSSSNEDWKRRDAPKHAPYLEPVSPPDHHANSSVSCSSSSGNRSGATRRYSTTGAGSGSSTSSGAGNVLTAFDYVTNRIVEVMRDADKPLYTYPYSALSVCESTPATPGPPLSAPAPALPTPLEPAPLMCAQYEPLSDED